MTMVANEDEQWAVLKCRGNSERKIAMLLKHRAGIDAFTPSIVSTVIISGRPQNRTQALFPGYLMYRHFDHINQHSWRLINGISGSVRNGGKVCILPFGFVAEIRRRCGPDGLFVPPKIVAPKPTRPVIAAGTRVRFSDGPFCGVLGVVAETSADARIKILFAMLGAERSLEVERDQIEIVR